LGEETDLKKAHFHGMPEEEAGVEGTVTWERKPLGGRESVKILRWRALSRGGACLKGDLLRGGEKGAGIE